MAGEFTDVTVVPHWGKNQVRVIWSTIPDIRGGEFELQRSRDGIQGFVKVAEVMATTTAVDDVVPTDRISEYWYRVVCTHNHRVYVSDVVGTFSKVPRIEFGLAAQIIKEEHYKLQRGKKIQIYRQKLDGPFCPFCTDSDTGQRTSSALCEQCYGTGIEGGFEPAIDSFMVSVAESAQQRIDVPSGEGSVDPQTFKARLPAYPPLRKDDVIVDTKADKRWLVESVTMFSVNANVPCMYDAGLQLMRRPDIRYKLGL